MFESDTCGEVFPKAQVPPKMSRSRTIQSSRYAERYSPTIQAKNPDVGSVGSVIFISPKIQMGWNNPGPQLSRAQRWSVENIWSFEFIIDQWQKKDSTSGIFEIYWGLSISWSGCCPNSKWVSKFTAGHSLPPHKLYHVSTHPVAQIQK